MMSFIDMRLIRTSIIIQSLFLCLLLFLISCTPNGIYHTVQPGQTLYRIAKTYEIEENELARVNHISDPKKLRAGQRVYIPGITQTRKVPSSIVSSVRKPVASKQTSTSAKAGSVKAPAKQKTASGSTVTRSSKSSSKSTPKATKGMFVWPLKGKILNEFGAKSDTPHKGIEIAAKSGASIVASAPGKVIYSGNAIRGYGNLIILEHSDSYFTVYGYNKRNLVAIDDYVGQGDKIAVVGSPPNGKSPRLHFEVRHGKSAVNPIFYLP